ncbi:MAG: GGDEF domain-containing protein [Oscillospiraceae bacterium]|nr:GGDEF domain-containing protein [Oscillospiraceae bacterium]
MGLPDRKWAKRLLDYTSEGMLGLHVLLAFYYATYSVMPMFAVTAACALVNAIGFFLMRKGFIRTQIVMLYLSELAHIVASVVGLGWSAGFQLPLVGLTCMIFLGEFLGRLLKLPYIKALPLGIVNLAIYALVYPRFFHQDGLLAHTQASVFVIQLIWSGCVFALLILGLRSVMHLTSVSQHSLTNKAETDELTGLINRAGYDRLLEELDVHDSFLLLVDTDKFKGINDRFGHETGDRVLQKISKSLLANFRQEDYVCRIGGDEFAVLMMNAAAMEDDRIREKVRFINRELAASAADELPTVSVSVGAARGTGAENWTALFKQADAALYQVKKAGGRGCRIYEKE